MVARQKVKSHRAFIYKHGLYDVDEKGVFTFDDGQRMMLIFQGDPVPYGCAEDGSNLNPNLKIGEKQFITSLLNKLSDVPPSKKFQFPDIPPWLIILIIVGIMLVI